MKMQQSKCPLALILTLFVAVMTTAVAAEPPLQTHAIRRVAVISGEAAGGLALPSDVVVVKERVYVVDGGHHRVAVFDRSGKYLFAFGQQGSAKGDLEGPVGIGADLNGRIYVADRGNHRIQVFDRDGIPLKSIAVKVGGKLVRPIDVAVTPDGGALFVTGNDNHSVLVFSRVGELLRMWGGSGADLGKFRYPATIVVAADGHVAVVDIFNTRVQVFDQRGGLITSIGDWGVLSGQFVRPKGVAVDHEGRFFVSDSYMDLVQAFDDSGHFLYVLGDNGKPYKMTSPAGMAIDDSGRLYVAEMIENKVSVFELGQ